MSMAALSEIFCNAQKGNTMRRLQMGMWHAFNKKDWALYSTPEMTGLEISQYESENKIKEINEFCAQNGLAFGIHTPVLQELYSLPQLAGEALADRDAAFKRIEREASIASKYGADYLLFHFPFPPIFASEKNDEYWKGYPTDYPYLKSEDMDREAFLKNSIEAFERLCEIQHHSGQKIVLEYDFFGDFEDVFVELFTRFPELELVIDTQRIDMHKRTFQNFEPYKWLDRIANNVYLTHYSNIKYSDPFIRHLPVLKEQCEETEYGESYQYLAYLAQKNDRFHVTFEHNPTLVTPEELRQCYREVSDLLLASKF
ncbi:MAG: TIM barrel protein [Tuberibacillus sp.]